MGYQKGERKGAWKLEFILALLFRVRAAKSE